MFSLFFLNDLVLLPPSSFSLSCPRRQEPHRRRRGLPFRESSPRPCLLFSCRSSPVLCLLDQKRPIDSILPRRSRRREGGRAGPLSRPPSACDRDLWPSAGRPSRPAAHRPRIAQLYRPAPAPAAGLVRALPSPPTHPACVGCGLATLHRRRSLAFCALSQLARTAPHVVARSAGGPRVRGARFHNVAHGHALCTSRTCASRRACP